jgi:sugar phosphate isomerase/epimerase
VEYDDYQAERRRIIAAWGTEITDPEQLAAAVDRLRELAGTVDGEAQRAKAIRYLKSMDTLVVEARAPESETLRQAFDALLRASVPDGTPAERRARAQEGMREIARIADAAPTPAEKLAALNMTEPLAEIVHTVDAG